MTIQFIFPKTTGKVAIINGEMVEYNGITSPGLDEIAAKKFYPAPKYTYLGKGTKWGSDIEQHFFIKNIVNENLAQQAA